MIVNTARKYINECNSHFKTKKRVGMIADKLMSSLGRELGYEVRTVYEFLFDEIMTPRGVRCYRGDIVLFMIKFDSIDKVFDIEIDGFKKTDSKMNFRDIALKGGVTLPPAELLERALRYRQLSHPEIIPCPTLRISAFIDKIPDRVIDNEIELFYFSNKMQQYTIVN